MDAEPVKVAEGVWRVTAGAFPSNAYICVSGEVGDGFVVDPGLDPFAIDAACQALGVTPRQVFCTHGHFDHVGGASHFQQAYGAQVFLHPADLKTMKSGNFLLMAMRMKERIVLPRVTPLEREVCLARRTQAPHGSVRFLHTPGHTPGSGMIAWKDNLFTGDSLYARGVGLSNLPGEDHDQLRASLRAVWDEIGEATLIHPGHGPSARFGDVRRGNEALRRFLGHAEQVAA